MFQDISIEELIDLQKNKQILTVDVRSQAEYEDSTLPGSINIPLFNNEERKEVGTLYKQVSSKAAKDKGLEIVSKKLPDFIKSFEELDTKKAVFCWRGGMRSKTTATVLSLMGIHVYRLKGGIRDYRKWVMSTLESFSFKPRCIVLNGYTGVGKTSMLHLLAERGYPILDLEGMAQHRGSIFGQIGLQPRNQKSFESLVVNELLRVNEQPYVFMEAESKRIGKVVLPEVIIEAKQKGIEIFIDMPLKNRVKHIIKEYDPKLHKEECIAAFSLIKKKIHTPIAKKIENHLQQDEFEEAVTLMLEHYYDQRYDFSSKQNDKDSIVFHVENIEEAVERLSDEIKKYQLNNNEKTS